MAKVWIVTRYDRSTCETKVVSVHASEGSASEEAQLYRDQDKQQCWFSVEEWEVKDA